MVLAASPFAFLGLIVVNARAAYHDWHPSEYGERVHQDWLAYAEPVRASKKLDKLPKDVKPEDVDAATKLWLAGYRRGDLRNIAIVDLADVAYEGPRAELMAGRNAVVYHILHLAKAKADRQDFDGSTARYLDAIELCQINKYSTPSAVAESSRLQAVALKRLASVVTMASPESWNAAQTRIHSMLPDPVQLRHVMARLQVMYNLTSQTSPQLTLNEGTKMAFTSLIAGDLLSSSKIVALTDTRSGNDADCDAFTNLLSCRDASEREFNLRSMLEQTQLAMESRDQRERARKPLLLVSTKTFAGDKASGNVSTVSVALNSQATLLPVSAGNKTGTR